MALTDGAKAALLEGVVRSVSKEVYGKGPQHIRCVCYESVFLIRCKGVLSAIELGLTEQGTEGVHTLKRIRRELFEKEREMIREQLECPEIRVETVLQEFRHDRDERLLVVITEETA